jgi:hypothetical protein
MRTDGQRLAQIFSILNSLADETAAIVLHDALATASSELGIELDSNLE